jgi:hypothetical protein
MVSVDWVKTYTALVGANFVALAAATRLVEVRHDTIIAACIISNDGGCESTHACSRERGHRAIIDTEGAKVSAMID